jgi:hypothetical protein
MSPFAALPAVLRRRSLAALAAWQIFCCVLAAPLVGWADESPVDASAAQSPPRVCQTFRVRPQDEVWAVSTRCLGCPSGGEPEIGWSVWKYEPQTPRWVNATAGEFYDGDAAKAVTAMYIHGNQIDSSLALRDGLNTYFQLAGRYDEEVPVRFVIWSWPSDKVRGPIRDGRSKADRSDTDAYYLARFLAPLKAESRVGLVGYSFGARIIAGAMHLVGGGHMCGLTAPPSDARFRIAFWAAAEHDDWLLPNRTHGNALPLAEHWLITRNCCDPALARYGWIDRGCDPVAVGYSGLVGRNLLTAEQNARIEEINVSHMVGKTHDNEAYLCSESIMVHTRRVVLWHD